MCVLQSDKYGKAQAWKNDKYITEELLNKTQNSYQLINQAPMKGGDEETCQGMGDQ